MKKARSLELKWMDNLYTALHKLIPSQDAVLVPVKPGNILGTHHNQKYECCTDSEVWISNIISQFQSFQLFAQFSSLADFMFCIDNLIVPLLNCHLLHKYVSNMKLFMPRRLWKAIEKNSSSDEKMTRRYTNCLDLAVMDGLAKSILHET